MEKKFWFKNSRGIKLRGILIEPNKTPKTITVLAHGFANNKNNFTNRALVPLLAKHGVATFRFDFTGHGESQGKFSEITPERAAADVVGAVQFVKMLGYTNISLFGSSFGGLAATRAAAKLKNIRCLALKAPAFDMAEVRRGELSTNEFKTWQRTGQKKFINQNGQKLILPYSFYTAAQRQTGYVVAKKIMPPVFIVHGERDTVAPLTQSKKFCQRTKNCTLKIIRGANHRFTNPHHFLKMINLIVQFIVGQNKKPAV